MRTDITKKGSALVISIIITMFIIVIALYLFDKIVPFSRSIKGIENGNVAYYNAETAINEALLAMSGSNPGYETGSNTVINNKGYVLKMTASGKIIPQAGKGTSEYDPDWNRIGPGEPTQLALPTTIPVGGWGDITLKFRVPDLNKNGTVNDETLSGTTTPIINWILTGTGESLMASGSQILASHVFKSNGTIGTSVDFTNVLFKDGLTLSGSTGMFANFHNSYCTTITCTLKLSVINPLILTDGTSVPYLEYQLDMGSNPSIPYQYANIEARGYSAGFRKDIIKSIRQVTTSEASDFTVFQ